jgi:uncharacterized protein (DUF1015 family)
MAGPVADRLALMSATDANLEPIYLVYDGGGAASQAVHDVSEETVLAHTVTSDGTAHRLWALRDERVLTNIATDLRGRRAMIADGHHRYATYRELQQLRRAEHGGGPWDRGLTLLVDSSSYGPHVHAIHRVLVGVSFEQVIGRAQQWGEFLEVADPAEGLRQAETVDGFAVVIADNRRAALLIDSSGRLAAAAAQQDEPTALSRLDVTVLHRVLVKQEWGLADTVEDVGYAHSVDEAMSTAAVAQGVAVLLRPTPIAAVAAVAAAGARMPRKSTLFTPKPASGLLMRRFADEA